MTGELADRTAGDTQETSVPDIDTPTDALTPTEALDRKRDALARMPETEILRPPGLDALAAASVVMGSLPRIERHRAALVEMFGERAVVWLDDLPVTARATMQASVAVTAAASDADLRDSHALVLADHSLLVTDADALANRKLIDRARIDAGRSTQGYRTTASSTLVLVSVLHEHWDAIAGKTPLTHAELDAIAARAHDMIRRLAEREMGATRFDAIELRARALSMLLRSYGEVRRMVAFVRFWEGDADAIAPSPWTARRRGRRSSTSGADPAPTAGVVPPPQLPAPVTPVDGGGPVEP